MNRVGEICDFNASTNPLIAHPLGINQDASLYFNSWTNMYDSHQVS